MDFKGQSSSCNDLLEFLRNHMPNLKTLKIENPFDVKKPRDEQIEESELKVLQIETLIIHDWQTEVDQREIFLNFAPNIKKLFIKSKTSEKLTAGELKVILKLVNLEEFEIRGVIEVDEEVLALLEQSKVRRITVGCQKSNLDEVTEICEKLKAANPRMVVIMQRDTSTNLSDSGADEINNLFETSTEY